MVEFQIKGVSLSLSTHSSVVEKFFNRRKLHQRKNRADTNTSGKQLPNTSYRKRVLENIKE